MLAEETDIVVALGAQASITAKLRRGTARRQAPLVLHLHGGAFQDRESKYGDCVTTLLVEAGAVVISPAYPAGRAHPFPEALEAAYACLVQIHKDRTNWVSRTSPLFVAGEEAGGNLAAALAMLARDRGGPPLAGQILISPMLDSGMATCSIRNANAGPVGCKWADGWRDYLGVPEKASHPYANPGAATRLAGLAPALVLTAEDDPMRDESIAYAARLRDSLVPVGLHILASPTGWPDALDTPEPPSPPCREAAFAALTSFFANPTQTTPPQRT